MSDKDLITGCLKNDRNSQRALFDKYSGTMKSVCLRYLGGMDQEAEDILQDGFIIVFEKLKTYKFEGSFEGWIRRIIVNLCLKYLIENKKSNVEDIGKVGDFEDSNIDIINKMTVEKLMQNVMDMPGGYRTVFNMFVIEGYNHREIAKVLKIEESTSRSQLAKAKLFLRNRLNESDFS